jgi:hypothetical protein
VQRHPVQSRAAEHTGTIPRVASDVPPAAFDAPDTHPNLPRRGALALMFAAIVVCGLVGGAIGYGLVNTSCPSQPTVAEHLIEVVPGYHAHTPSCGLKLAAGALTGTAITAIGAGVVAMLVLRAQSEWQTHPAAGPPAGATPPVRKPRSGGTPPRT